MKDSFSVHKKAEVVLCRHQGEDPDALLRELGVSAVRWSEWRGDSWPWAPQARRAASPMPRTRGAYALRPKRPETLVRSDPVAEGGALLGLTRFEAMSRATSPLLYQRYGIWTVAKEWDTVRSTVYAAGMRSETPVVPLKVAPGSAMGTALTEHIRRLIVGSPFPGEDHRTICAKLRGLRGRGQGEDSIADADGSTPSTLSRVVSWLGPPQTRRHAFLASATRDGGKEVPCTHTLEDG